MRYIIFLLTFTLTFSTWAQADQSIPKDPPVSWHVVHCTGHYKGQSVYGFFENNFDKKSQQPFVLYSAVDNTTLLYLLISKVENEWGFSDSQYTSFGRSYSGVEVSAYGVTVPHRIYELTLSISEQKYSYLNVYEKNLRINQVPLKCKYKENSGVSDPSITGSN